jgi:hypothetical protein
VRLAGRPRVPLSALGAAVVIAASGCGAPVPDDAAAVRTAVTFHHALAAKDRQRACDLLASSTRENVAQKDPCPKAIADLDVPDAERLISVSTFGRQAQVKLDGDVTFLTVDDGLWRVRAAGCKPDNRASAGGVYNCEVKD